jgi:hypothetical protein
MLGSLFSVDAAVDAYLLVYDITSQASLENLEYFDELIEKNLDTAEKGASRPVKMVVANKSDLADIRVVSAGDGSSWAHAHGCGFMETSAKAMVNIEETFQEIVRQVVANRRALIAERAGVATGGVGRGTAAPSGGKSSHLRNALSSANLKSKDGSVNRSGCCLIL